MLKMNNKWLQNLQISPAWLPFLVIVLLIMGIFFRFVNIDQKLYWVDEVYTSLRVSGYLNQEMEQQLGDGHLIGANDLQKYQYPNREKNTLDTINGLIAEESQLSPLYFVIVRWWVQLFGNSIAITRSLSAFISLLTFPSIYWLCQELFESRLIGWMAIATVAISPVHVIYAQDARPYSLSIVAVLLSGAALLRAMRLQTKMSWGIYGSTLTLGLYTQLFFGFVIAAQSIYIILIERFRLTRKLISYIITVVLGVLTFAPWIWIFITHPTPGNISWVNTKQTLGDVAIRWVGIISRTAIDFGIGPNDPFTLKIAVMPLVLMVFYLIVYATYFLCCKTPKKVWLFIIISIGSICLPLMFLDFGLGKRYGTTRYILPSTLGMQLAIVYLLSVKINVSTDRQWQQKIWSAIFCGLITVGVISCTISSQSQMWWNKGPELYQKYPQTVNIINRSERPLVITDESVITLQIIGHLVNPNTKFQVIDKHQIPAINTEFSEVFVFMSSESLKSKIRKVYNSPLKMVNELLWQVTKSN
jgi:uncharacterized membrane protein